MLAEWLLAAYLACVGTFLVWRILDWSPRRRTATAQETAMMLLPPPPPEPNDQHDEQHAPAAPATDGPPHPIVPSVTGLLASACAQDTSEPTSSEPVVVPVRTPETPESRTHRALMALRERIAAGHYASDRASEHELRAGFLAYLVEHGHIGS